MSGLAPPPPDRPPAALRGRPTERPPFYPSLSYLILTFANSKGFHLKRIPHSWIQCKECLCHLNCLPFGYNEDNFRCLRCSEPFQSPVFSLQSSPVQSQSEKLSIRVKKSYHHYHQYHLYHLIPVIEEICLTRG